MKITKAKIGYILFIICFTVICAEIGGRFYLSNILEKSATKKFRFNSYRVYEHIPNFTEGNEEGDWIVINSDGFRRSEEVNKEKGDDTYRVFLLGGSAGHGISSGPPYPVRHIYMNETIDGHMERLLKDFPGKKIEVINAAVTGYQVFQHTPYILSELLDYDPDLIIFFDGANDHYANNPNFDYWGDFRYQFWKDRLQDPSIGGAMDYAANYGAEFSGLMRGYFSWRLQKDAMRSSEKSDMRTTYKDEALLIENHKIAAKKQFLRSIQTNLDILKREGVDVILGLQPMLVLRDKEKLSKEETAFLHVDRNVEVLYPVVKSELEELAAKDSVVFIDFNPLFNNEEYKGEQLLIDYCHLSSKGGEVVADTLSKMIISKLSTINK